MRGDRPRCWGVLGAGGAVVLDIGRSCTVDSFCFVHPQTNAFLLNKERLGFSSHGCGARSYRHFKYHSTLLVCQVRGIHEAGQLELRCDVVELIHDFRKALERNAPEEYPELARLAKAVVAAGIVLKRHIKKMMLAFSFTLAFSNLHRNGTAQDAGKLIMRCHPIRESQG